MSLMNARKEKFAHRDSLKKKLQVFTIYLDNRKPDPKTPENIFVGNLILFKSGSERFFLRLIVAEIF